MSYQSTLVKLPDGTIRAAELGELTGTGFRYARVRLGDDRASVSGRVATTDRKAVKKFQVNLASKNAHRVFETVDREMYR